MRLYPPVKIVRQSFAGSKVCTIPNQSMTLHDIIKRFLRKESLPIEHSGVYATGFGDVEKLGNMDIVERKEYGERLGAKLKKAWKDRQDKEGKVESPSVPATPPSPTTAPPAAPGNTPPPAPSQAGGGT